MTKDVLTILAAEMSCEQLFSSEHDINNYHYDYLFDTIIENLMIIKHYEH